MRGKHAAQRSGRHRGATAIADDRHELRSTRSPPGSAGVSPACAPDARVPRVSGRPTSPFAPCGSIAGRSQSRATEMNFGLRWRRLGARSSRPPARRRRAHPGHLHLQWEKGVAHRDRFFWQAPACHLPFQPSGRPNSPFSPCGRRGQGGCGATARRSSVITACVALPHEWLAD
jgi:hypothetical protein